MKQINYDEFHGVCVKLDELRKDNKRMERRVQRVLLKNCRHRGRDGHALVCNLEGGPNVGCGVANIDNCDFFKFIFDKE